MAEGQFNERLLNENAELVKKLGSLLSEEDLPNTLRELNYMLKQKIAKQQTAIGEVADPVGVSPKEMKQLRKAFNKYDKDGNGTIDKGELKALADDLAEPLTEEEIASGMESMANASGKLSFDEFVNWISDERDKESHKGMKMRMLKLKMRATHMKAAVSKGMERAPSFTHEYVECPDNLVRVSFEAAQGADFEGKTKIDMLWTPTHDGSGQAALTAMNAPAEAKACVCFNIQLQDGVKKEDAVELESLYDQIFDMAQGEEMVAEMGPEMFLVGKPKVAIADVDGVTCLQLQVFFSCDPLGQFNIDSRHLKTLHARMQWAHTIDEIKEPAGESLDVLSLEGLKLNFKSEIDRKLVEYLSANEQVQALMNDMGDEGMEDENPMAMAFAAALTFGSVDVIVKTRSVMEMFNKTIRENIKCYDDFLSDKEDKRFIDAQILETIPQKIAELYATAEGPMQNIYVELQSKIAGPHSIKAFVPTGEITISTAGLQNLYAFFPPKEELEKYAPEGGDCDDDDDDW